MGRPRGRAVVVQHGRRDGAAGGEAAGGRVDDTRGVRAAGRGTQGDRDHDLGAAGKVRRELVDGGLGGGGGGCDGCDAVDCSNDAARLRCVVWAGAVEDVGACTWHSGCGGSVAQQPSTTLWFSAARRALLGTLDCPKRSLDSCVAITVSSSLWSHGVVS